MQRNWNDELDKAQADLGKLNYAAKEAREIKRYLKVSFKDNLED